MTIKIALGGPRGKMGQAALQMIKDVNDFDLIACIDRYTDEKTKAEIEQVAGKEISLYDNASACFTSNEIDVYVDLTIPEAGYEYTKTALENSVYSVVGTSGFTDQQIDGLRKLAEDKKTGCIIAPNFALGSIVMMLFSKMAAKYFPDVEIIEKHHDNKVDAPSGTAVKTLEMIHEVRDEKVQGHPNEYESMPGARGASDKGVHIHSMRLPGLVAHQEVVFGSTGQLLTLKHDVFDRQAYMDGLQFAIKEVLQQDKLIYGLEHVLQLD